MTDDAALAAGYRRANHVGAIPDRLNIWALPHPPAWHEDAACTSIGGDEWFPNKGESTRDAKGICRTCPVITQCLNWALDHDERFGVWGGLSERERRKLKPTRRHTTASDDDVRHTSGSPCIGCGALTYNRHSRTTDRPAGAVAYSGKGLCDRCVSARRRAARKTAA